MWNRYVKREMDGERVIVAFVDCVLRRLYWARLPDMVGPFRIEDLTGSPADFPIVESKYGTTEQLYWPALWFQKVVAEWDASGLHDREAVYGAVPNWVSLSDTEADALHALRAPSSLSGIARLAVREDERAAYHRFAADWTRRNDQMALF
jgi:hypothetical protein